MGTTVQVEICLDQLIACVRHACIAGEKEVMFQNELIGDIWPEHLPDVPERS